ncbi:long-chain fatty acid--CoA ligase [Rhodococcus sp. SRB_17]|uniref:class I adenylate-forming enzyme family protein n=1 Tax=Rhodococcus sp. OK302 TaxID=1882769 RepID=UPI000B944A3D|nr:AMP-binding protein [Rhodococcus sp. OK302]NMM88368.1 long-chain fatty acid--CoA ligase [Rhodococcus sp. SRB_17]OYD71873.1 acyl-CoA synthetase (AMP-forming)/AMP-acid ligase II [Rhodococcus sp. OK302]
MALSDFFDQGWNINPKAVAYRHGDTTWTFDEAGELSCRVTNALLRDGIQLETKIAVLSPNDPAAWLCVIGAWRAGGAWVPLNPNSPVSDSIGFVQRFDCEVLFYHPSKAASVDEIHAAVGDAVRYVCLDGDSDGHRPYATPLQEWLGDVPATRPRVDIPQDSLAIISPTGGTTGLPKGVMNTHRSFGMCITQLMMAMPYRADEPVVNLAAAPMTHSAGILTLPASARGGSVVVLARPDPTSLLDAIDRHHVTDVFLPPTVIYRLIETPDLGNYDLSSLRYFLYGSAPMSVEKLRQAIGLFGPVMIECFGQTEAPGSIAFLRPEEHFVNGEIADDKRLLSCGRPFPLVKIEIRDDEHNPVPTGTHGEICVRGDLVMRGYYKNPEATAEAVRDGWLYTGDIGFLDDRGFLTLTDRKKDMIISGGFNVFPAEVEQIIWTHPAVQDCAVIGVPDATWGEAVTAVVELKPDADIDIAELLELCREKLGSVRTPKRVDIIERLPRSVNGKVLKKDLRELYWTNEDRRV